MKISTKGRYGLRVMVELAGSFGQGPVLVESVARREELSAKYIHVLMTGLRSAGLIRTVRGPHGGYELTRPPAEITVLDVVSALEGRSAPVDCVVSAAVCPRSTHCALRDVWCDVAAAMDNVLAGITLEELRHKQRVKRGEGSG